MKSPADGDVLRNQWRQSDAVAKSDDCDKVSPESAFSHQRKLKLGRKEVSTAGSVPSHVIFSSWFLKRGDAGVLGIAQELPMAGKARHYIR